MPPTPPRLAAAALTLAAACFGVSHPLLAQDPDDVDAPVGGPGLALGAWRGHLPAQYAVDVTACGAFTAYATQGGTVVLRYRATGELVELGKVDGLSGSDIATVACNPAREGQLFVAYRDGVLDVVEGGRVTLTATAVADAEIAGLRDVRGVAFAGADTAIVYADFGFVLFDPDEGIFLDDVRWGAPVNDVAAFAGDLYVAAGDGMYVLPDYARQPTLRDLSRYRPLGEVLPAGAGFAAGARLGATALEVWRGRLYAGFGDGSLAAIAPGAAGLREVDTGGGEGRRVVDLSGADEVLAVAYGRREGGTGDAAFATADGEAWTRLDDECAGLPFAVAATPGGGVAFAARVERGLCRVASVEAGCACSDLRTPFAPGAYAIALDRGRVAVASGGLNQQGSGAGTANGIYVRDEAGRWTNFNRVNTAAFASESEEFRSPKDFVTVAFSPAGELHAGAYEEGLVRFTPDLSEAVRVDERTSSLQVSQLSSGVPRVGGLAFAPDGTLWVGNTEAARPLSARTSDGEWGSLDPACGANNLYTIVIDPATGVLWIVDKGFGLIAYDPMGTPLDAGDDRCRNFGTADGLPANDVRSVVVDRRGNVYVGTTNGTAVLRGIDPFDGDSFFERPPVEVEGLSGFAFDEETVRAIVADGGNRKWVGTNSGLFLVSPDTREQLAVYTTANSPLPSDRVDALAFDDATGELWVGTPAGLMSLQTASTGGRELAHGLVEVFPQPVAPDYDGPIAIRGLALDADVKITDAAGRLVYETTAVGGTATWDGRDYTGRRPASGVYFVWGTAARALEQPDGVVAKIALIR